MNRLKRVTKLLAATFLTLAVSTVSAKALETSIYRIGGADRVKTSEEISSKYENPQNIIIAYSNNYPDSLTACILSKKYNAPILLTNESKYDETVKYIKSKVPKNGIVYIAGGEGVIKPEFAKKIKNEGYSVKRLGGVNRFETNMQINKEANVDRGTPIFICYSNDYPDALSASSISGYRGYPIVLSQKGGLNSEALNYIRDVNPKEVYITGGTGVIDKNVENQLKNICPSTKIERLAGNNRFETSLKIVKTFGDSTDTLCVASGLGYADAVSGGALAAKLNSNVLLVNQSLNDNQIAFIEETNFSKVIIFGKEGAVSTVVENKLHSILEDSGDFQVVEIE